MGCGIIYSSLFAAVAPYGNGLYTYKFKCPLFEPREASYWRKSG